MVEFDELKERIRSANDIVDVIGSYVTLKRNGNNYMGLCPFHRERTPSFSVSPSRQMFYCFGCNKGGDVYKFIEDYENVNFHEAVELLAGRAGIEMPDKVSYSGRRSEKIEKLREINKETAVFYYGCLQSLAGKKTYDYLIKRGVSPETIKKFGIGYAPEDGSLYRHLKNLGYEDDSLKESGIFSYKTSVHDKFFGRVIFPIMDDNRRVIGFGGRTVNDRGPKYLNSPETAVFEKGKNLYGFHIARKTKNNRIILVEGYMDVISMQQAGFTETVASLGTALTFAQARKIARVAKDVYIIYDTDSAGTKAKLRAIPILQSAGLNPYVVDLEEYKDPDEAIKAQGKDFVESALENAQDGVLFEVEEIENKYDRSKPAQESEFMQEVIDLIAGISAENAEDDGENEIKRYNYKKIISKEFNIPAIAPDEIRRGDGPVEKKIARMRRDGAYEKEREIREKKARNEELVRASKAEADGSLKTKRTKMTVRGLKSPEENVFEKEEIIITMIAMYPGLFKQVEQYITMEQLPTPLARKIGLKLKEQIEAGEENILAIYDEFDESDKPAVSRLINSGQINAIGDNEEGKKKALSDAVKGVLLYNVEKELKEADINSFQKILNKRRETEGLVVHF